MKKFIFLSCILICSFLKPAHADWKQVRWGMSVDQVQSKVSDAHSVSTDPAVQYQYNVVGSERVLLAEDVYHVADMVYSVRYIFGTTNQLKAIVMRGDEYNYIRTFDLLSGKYGKPASYSGNGDDMSYAIWNVPEKHLMIKLNELRGTSIRYEPITDAL
ncbi:hypothetical protein [Acetobacter sp. KSO5]|uniref:hypothetical protein n=1 Tax=Acetobacter sp. KSO5 TaxID=3373674 RepID=UPI00376EB7B1